MKNLKIFLTILLCILLLPCIVNAKEYCKVISGNGKDIGSEIACGTEHFYIVDSNQDEVKMLAKYNLNVGVTIYKEKIEKGAEDSRSDQQYCQDLAISKNGEVKSDDFYNAPGYCFYAINMQPNIIQQDERAKSAHQDREGNYLYPQIGDVYPLLKISSNVEADFYEVKLNSEKYDNYFYDLPLSEGQISTFLTDYNNKLNNDGYETKKYYLLSLDELNTIVKKRGKSIPYHEWYENSLQFNNSMYGKKFQFGILKDYLDISDNWIYDRTYWLVTGYGDFNNFVGPNTARGLMFVDNYGDICGSSSVGGLASGCVLLIRTGIGAGIRPVITIPNELQYLIKTKTDGNGSIEVVSNALGGENIEFKVNTKKGYKLSSVIVRTDSGEVVEFSEGEIIKNADGTYTIDKNKFKMPFENVTIEGKFVSTSILANPKTISSIGIVVLVLSIIFGTLMFTRRKKLG